MHATSAAPAQPLPLSTAQQGELLDIARRAVLKSLTHTGLHLESHEVSAPLRIPSGAFVSLHIDDQLRGCIGSIYAESPLYLTVSRMAVRAATDDPRFSVLSNAELSRTDFEVSVLSELAPIRPEDVEPGVHGLFIVHGSRRGLLLPQVAKPLNWSRKELLQQLCTKAGLPGNAWKDSACCLQGFTATVFSESSLYDALPDDI